MEEKKSLSQFGIGPYYAATSAIITALALFLNISGNMPVLKFEQLVLPLKFLSFVLICAAALMWFNAVITMKIAYHIHNNELVTSGAYALVRNPIYSAVMFVMWGLLLWSGNLLLIALCPVYHVLMAVMVKSTEEKWLTDLYGQKYIDYCKKVNRCIPWFQKKGW